MCEAYADLIADRSLIMIQVHAQSVSDLPEIRVVRRRIEFRPKGGSAGWRAVGVRVKDAAWTLPGVGMVTWAVPQRDKATNGGVARSGSGGTTANPSGGSGLIECTDRLRSCLSGTRLRQSPSSWAQRNWRRAWRGTSPNLPEWKSLNACSISAWVFMTNGPPIATA